MKQLCEQLKHEMVALFQDETLYAAMCAKCGYRCGATNRPLTLEASNWMLTKMFEDYKEMAL